MMALPQGVTPGMRVTARRAGWDEVLDPWQYLDMEPVSEKNYDSLDLEGVLEVITAGYIPGVGKIDVYFVGGLEADPKTVKPSGGTTDNSFCPTGPGGGVDPSCSPGQGGIAGKSAPTWWAEMPLKERESLPGVSKGARLKSYAQLSAKDKAAVDSAHKGTVTKVVTPHVPLSQESPRADSPPPYEHVRKVLDGVNAVGKGHDKFTSLADLKDHTGLSVGDMHKAVNKLRSDGVLDASALEGRQGVTGREVDSSVREGDRLIGYVSLKG